MAASMSRHFLARHGAAPLLTGGFSQKGCDGLEHWWRFFCSSGWQR
jgi:hypothetical protein